MTDQLPLDAEEVPEATIRLAHHFAMIPVGVLKMEISGNAFRIYCILRSYARPGRATFPHIATACETYGIAERTFRRGLAELTELGLVVIGKHVSAGGFRRSNEYFFPDVSDDGMAEPQRSDLAGMQRPSTADVERPSVAGPKEEEKTEVEKSKKGAKAPNRPHVLPESWFPTAEMKAWCNSEHHGVDGYMETTKFVDYFRAKGTKYLDWDLAWKNWIKRADNVRSIRPAVPQRTKSTVAEDFYREEGIIP